jgi:large subunit ribosomal protein L1
MGKMKTTFVGNDENKNDKKHEQAHQASEGKVHIAGLKGGQRVKIVEAASSEEAPAIEVNEKTEGTEQVATSSKTRVERVRGKKYLEAKAKFDREKPYKVEEAIKLVKSTSYSKFDGTMELHLVVKKTGTSAQVTLPFQAGRQKKVEIADEETVNKLKEGKIDFDILVATMDMMPKLVPFARLLGPKGLMPNPKNGTLVADIKKAKTFSSGAVTLKTEKEAPLIHTVIGKNSQKDEEITQNAEAVLKALGGSKQIVRAFVKSTMSPSVKLQLS